MRQTNGNDRNYFDLSDKERSCAACARKSAVERLLAEVLDWFMQYREWAMNIMDGNDEDEKAVVSFARDRQSSRMTMIWQNQVSHGKRKFLDAKIKAEDGGDTKRKCQKINEEQEKCEGCNGDLQWCCLACELAKMKTVSPLCLESF